MNKNDILRLRDTDIEQVAQRLGIGVKNHKSLCPFHDDSRPSLTFNHNRYRCWACGAHGDVIDLVMRYTCRTFQEACQWLASEYGLGSETTLAPPRPAAKPAPTFDARRYEPYLRHRKLSDRARSFLFDERLIDPRVVEWCRLSSWRDRGGVEWLQIPYFDPKGHLIGMQRRNLSRQTPFGSALDPSQPRFRFPAGSRCSIYNLPIVNCLHEGDELWIAEGPSDCWAMLSDGHKALAIPSATMLKKEDSLFLQRLVTDRNLSVRAWPDHDEAGEKLFAQLQDILPIIVDARTIENHKDYAEAYVAARSLDRLG